jgi:hypothetical protein
MPLRPTRRHESSSHRRPPRHHRSALAAAGIGLTALGVGTTGWMAPGRAAPAADAAVPSDSIAAGRPECTTAQLHASLGAGNGAAGSTEVALRLTNVGVTCVTRGYPGVSYVTGDAGTQVGRPAVRVSSPAPTTITLASGRTAISTLREVDALNYPAAACLLTPTRGLRVYPPDQRRALFVPAPGRACANPADTGLWVNALQPAIP